MQSDVVLREEWARDHNIGRVWVVSIANRRRRSVSVAPVAGNAYTGEMRLRSEQSQWTVWHVAHHLKPSLVVQFVAVAVSHRSMALRVMSRTSSRL